MDITENKIINGIKYFIKNTKYVGRTKLFKLLYFWDYFHFKKFGTSISGYEYYTYPFGPVPEKLYKQVKDDKLPENFKKHFVIIEDDKDDEPDEYKMFKFLLKNKKIDLEWLSPNEIEILKEVAFKFKYLTAKEMTEITHLPNTPWTKTKEAKGMFKPIDYFLVIDKETQFEEDLIRERYNTQQDLLTDGRI